MKLLCGYLFCYKIVTLSGRIYLKDSVLVGRTLER